MPQAHSAVRSVGTIIKVRTATGDDAVKATRSAGAGNSAIVFTAAVAGVAGNGISVEIVDAGAGNPTAVSVTSQAITIEAGNSGAGIDATVLEIIAAVANSDAADALVRVSTGAGDGSGVVGTLADGNLTGGADATHTFIEIPGVGDFTLPGVQTELLNITSHSSPETPGGNVGAEYTQSRIEDFPEFSIPLTWWNPTESAAHAQLKALEAGEGELFQFLFRENADDDFQAEYLVRSVERGAPVNGVYTATVTLKQSGAITLI